MGFNSAFKGLMCILNHGSFITFSIFELGRKLLQYCDVSFVFYLPEDGHMSGRNMLKVYGVYNILPHTYLHLLVFISYLLRSVACHSYRSYSYSIYGAIWRERDSSE
jgi:hypothetical protein